MTKAPAPYYNQVQNKIFFNFGTIIHNLGPKTYKVGFDGQSHNFYLEQTSDLHHEGKIYGNYLDRAKRIISTYKDRPKNTGVLLSGEKGNGKTALIKIISSELRQQNIPTLIISDPWHGEAFIKFVQDINQDCVVVFDEFEKVYDYKKQQTLLTLLDGVYSCNHKRLFLLTANDPNSIENHFFNRPGRIFYHLKYNCIDHSIIREICGEKLKNTNLTESIIKVSETVNFSFDILNSIIEECNRYNCSVKDALDMLNVRPAYQYEDRFAISVELNGTKQDISKWTNRSIWVGSPLLYTGAFVFTHDHTKNSFDSRIASKLEASNFAPSSDGFDDSEDIADINDVRSNWHDQDGDEDAADGGSNTDNQTVVEYVVLNQDNFVSMETNSFEYKAKTNLGNEFTAKFIKKPKVGFDYKNLGMIL